MSSLSDGKAWLAAIVESVMRRVDYHAQYVARVVTQHDDGSIDVVPDTDKIPPMTEVPIRYGVPGVSAKVKPGARVLIGFEAGDASRPIATVWESAAIEELRITSDKAVVVVAPSVTIGGDDDPRPVARMGDAVDILLSAASVTLAAAATPPSPVIPCVGIISTGAKRAKAS